MGNPVHSEFKSFEDMENAEVAVKAEASLDEAVANVLATDVTTIEPEA